VPLLSEKEVGGLISAMQPPLFAIPEFYLVFDGGGRRVEIYHLNRLLENVGLKLGERRKACQP
jgi:hypothetical protein